MKTILIIEIESEHDVADLTDKVGGRVWTMLDGKREVKARIASDLEIEAILLANVDHTKAESNGHIEAGAQYGY